MSKENVALFAQAIAQKVDLEKRVADCDEDVASIVKVANEAGFEFTADEFIATVGEVLGRSVNSQDAIREFRAVLDSAGPAEFGRQMLEGVVGGVAFAAYTVTVRKFSR